jgi:high-affinity iron transporter
MLAAGIIVFREVLEAALIVGIVLAATRGVAGSRHWVAFGIAGGLAGAALVAASADALAAALAGIGAELFNAAVLLLAVAMLAWHNAWMSRHGREMVAAMKAVGHAVSVGTRPLSVLAVVVGVAVLREGSETVLFLYGVATSGEDAIAQTAMGAAAGLTAGAGIGAGLYLGLLAIPTRHLFAVTSGLVTLLAAGMAAQAVHYLGAAGLIEAASDPVWDSSAILAEDSLAGRLLHTLVGYVEQPTAVQVAAYAATLVGITVLARMVRNADRRV